MPGAGARMEAEVGTFSSDINQIALTQETPLGTAYTVSVNPAAGGTARATYLLANYYVDFELGILKPYVSVGLGMAYVSLDHTLNGVQIMNDNTYNWAYQVGAGISAEVMQNVALEIGYRYMGIRDLTMNSPAGTASRVDLGAHQANVGVRVKF
jgi:opacity protein-like surface antigen